MKKTNFYTLCQENGSAAACLVSGYTDGRFNYYRTRAGWNVIIPDALVSVNREPLPTRSAAIELANSAQTSDLVKRYRDIVMTAAHIKKLAAMIDTARKQFLLGDFSHDYRNRL